VNCSFFLRLAASRTRPSAWVTRSRPWVRSVRYGSAFPLVPGLGSTGSATGRPDFVRSLHCYAGIRLLWVVHQRLRLGTFPLRTIRPQQGPMTDPEISRFPHKVFSNSGSRICMDGSTEEPIGRNHYTTIIAAGSCRGSLVPHRSSRRVRGR